MSDQAGDIARLGLALDTREFKAGGDTAVRTLADIKKAAQDSAAAQQGIQQQINNTASTLKRFAAIAGIGFGVRQIIQYADTWKLMEGKIRQVTSSTQELTSVQGALFDVANRTRTTYEGTVDLYTRLARSTKELGVSQSDLMRFTETAQKAIQVGGSTAEEARRGVIQLGQGLAAGRIAGQDLRSILEQTTGLARVIAEGMGVPMGKLKGLAAQGKLTADSVMQAVLKMSKQVDQEFSNVPITISQSFTVLKNEMLKFVGTADSASGVSSKIAEGIIYLAKHLDTLTYAFVALAAAAAVNWWGKLITGVQAATGANVTYISTLRAERAAALDMADAHLVETQAIQKKLTAKLADIDSSIARDLAYATENGWSKAKIANDERMIMLTSQRAALETSLATVTTRTVALQGVQVAAYEATTFAATAAAMATKTFSAALAMVGGVPGLVLLAIATAIYKITTATSNAEDATKKYAAEIANTRDRAKELNAELDKREAKRGGMDFGGKDLKDAADMMAKLKADLSNAGGVANPFVLMQAGAKEFFTDLNKLRLEYLTGKTTADQYAAAVQKLTLQKDNAKFRKFAEEILETSHALDAATVAAQKLGAPVGQAVTEMDRLTVAANASNAALNTAFAGRWADDVKNINDLASALTRGKKAYDDTKTAQELTTAAMSRGEGVWREYEKSQGAIGHQATEFRDALKSTDPIIKAAAQSILNGATVVAGLEQHTTKAAQRMAELASKSKEAAHAAEEQAKSNAKYIAGLQQQERFSARISELNITDKQGRQNLLDVQEATNEAEQRHIAIGSADYNTILNSIRARRQLADVTNARETVASLEAEHAELVKYAEAVRNGTKAIEEYNIAKAGQAAYDAQVAAGNGAMADQARRQAEANERLRQETAKIKTEEKQDDAQDATRAEDKAKAMQEPYLQALRSMQSAGASFFEDILNHGIHSWQKLADSMKGIFFKMLAEIASVKLVQSITATVGAGIAGAARTAGAQAGTGSFGGILSVVAGAQGASRATGAVGGGLGTAYAETAGLSGGLGFGGALRTAGAYGAVGLAAAGVGYGVGGMTTNKVIGTLGGALSGAATGALVGSVVPVVGTFVGGVVGGVIGAVAGLFGSGNAKKEKEKAQAELRKQMDAWMDGLAGTGGLTQALKDLKGQHDQLAASAKKLGLNQDALNKAYAAGVEKTKADAVKALQAQVNSMSGNGITNALDAINKAYTDSMKDAAVLGADGLKAVKDIKDLSTEAALRSLGDAGLQDVINKFGGAIGALAKQILDGTTLVNRASADTTHNFEQDLRVRELVARGQSKDAEKLRMQIQQERELAEARAQGLGTDMLNKLKEVQALETAALGRNTLNGNINNPDSIDPAYYRYVATQPMRLRAAPEGAATTDPIRGQQITITGDIHVTANDPVEFFDAVLEEGQRRSTVQFGTPDKWSEVQK